MNIFYTLGSCDMYIINLHMYVFYRASSSSSLSSSSETSALKWFVNKRVWILLTMLVGVPAAVVAVVVVVVVVVV